MTTAATVWAVGTIGIACGLGYYLLAATVVSLALLILTGLAWLERRLLGTK